MVKYNTPDWQISAFDKDNNSCVKTKPFNEKIKELEAAYAKSQETKAKVENIDTSAFYLKDEPVKEEKDLDVLKEYQDMRDRERAEELKRLREEDNKVKFTSVEPLRKDPNRGMRFVGCSNPINVGKLGSSRSFIKKIDRKYY
ncbi:hypothetical protein N9S28_03330 [Candidatus Pelagibacter sp.]|nr:hypothetical protein [Candidatus Pelagibacter sp.]